MEDGRLLHVDAHFHMHWFSCSPKTVSDLYFLCYAHNTDKSYQLLLCSLFDITFHRLGEVLWHSVPVTRHVNQWELATDVVELQWPCVTLREKTWSKILKLRLAWLAVKKIKQLLATWAWCVTFWYQLSCLSQGLQVYVCCTCVAHDYN